MNEEYENIEEDDVEYYAIRPNKSQLKRDIAVILALAEEIAELSVSRLSSLEFPEKLHNSFIEVSIMPHKSARKRLLKFITGQLHKMDMEPILEKMACLKSQSVHQAREHHLAESWRDRLIAEGNDALTQLLDEQPQLDRQTLRQLLRNAQKETELNKPPKSSRLLYRYLKDSLNNLTTI